MALGQGKKRQKILAGLFEGSGEVGREASRMYIIIVRLTYVALERWPGVFGRRGTEREETKMLSSMFYMLVPNLAPAVAWCLSCALRQ